MSDFKTMLLNAKLQEQIQALQAENQRLKSALEKCKEQRDEFVRSYVGYADQVKKDIVFLNSELDAILEGEKA